MLPALLVIHAPAERVAATRCMRSAMHVVERATRLAQVFRELRLPVMHVPAGSEPPGSPREIPSPPGLLPGALADETVLDGTAPDAALLDRLRALKVNGVALAGCDSDEICGRMSRLIQSGGIRVTVVEDAHTTLEPARDALCRLNLEQQTVPLVDTDTLIHLLESTTGGTDARSPQRTRVLKVDLLPAAIVDGRWLTPVDGPVRERRNPGDWEQVLCRIRIATAEQIHLACTTASRVSREWATTAVAHRANILRHWAGALERREDELACLLADEIGKPVCDARDEIRRAIAHIETAVQLFGAETAEVIDKSARIVVRHCPYGTVALITPWNNPVAIPAGKIAPALLLGNAVVWKPALEAPQTAMRLIETLREAGLPDGVLNLTAGEGSVARRIIMHPNVSAVSITGSIETGRSVAALCAALGKPLQAELGGNNAAIVLADADLSHAARGLATAAFSFAGQRCTAMRRIIVEKPVAQDFTAAWVRAVEELAIGAPRLPETQIGPMISRHSRQRVLDLLARAETSGARRLCGGAIPAGLERGCWLTPAIVSHVDPAFEIVRHETFGPVAVLVEADDLEHALTLANGVEQGLAAAIYTASPHSRARLGESLQAGMLNFSGGPLAVHPVAPFGGWKSSAVGPPEHGRWDLQAFSRPQTVYGAEIPDAAG